MTCVSTAGAAIPKFDSKARVIADDAASATSIAEMVNEAGYLLPRQAILENFVHHNPWEMLQHMGFEEAQEYVHKVSCYMSPGERLAYVVNTDPRSRVNEAVAELSGVFLDRGAAKWEAPGRDKGFLIFFASLEGLGLARWRKHARAVAARILEDPADSSEALAESILQENLEFFGTPGEHKMPTIRAMLWDLPGWAGMFQRMEYHKGTNCYDVPSASAHNRHAWTAVTVEAPHTAKIKFIEFAAVQSILLRSSIDAMARQSGWDPVKAPLSDFLSKAPRMRPVQHFVGSIASKRPVMSDEEAHDVSGIQNPSGLAFIDQNMAKVSEHEKEFARRTLAEITDGESKLIPRPALQVYTCIDERECSFRRHLEEATGNPNEIETLGIPGFFSFQIRYQGPDCREEVILGPEGCQPKFLIKEEEKNIARSEERRRLYTAYNMWEKLSFSPVGSLALSGIALPGALARLFLMSFFPTTTRKLTDRFVESVVTPSKTDFELPYSPTEASNFLAVTFKNVGVKNRFSQIVLLMGHGSRSVNNPFDAAHNCGACGGREGGPNARVMARCANDPAVRKELATNHGILIPDDTWFVGGYHDTTSELVELFDLESVPESLASQMSRAQEIIKEARGRNAMERCEKFMLANPRTHEDALRHVHTRSTDLGEARPELGHATNASVVIGRRDLTKGRFFSRRAFLPSYDPFNDNDDGTNLEQVLTPGLIVCSGISLEYLFSTTEGGAGSKVMMNLVGNFGVQQGTAGDLLVGLPTQMTEMHSPLRALYLIDAPPQRVEAVLSRNALLKDIVRNDWVLMYARDPVTHQFYKQSKGEWHPVERDALPDAKHLQYGSYHTGYIPFTHQLEYGTTVASHENLTMGAAAVVMLASCTVPAHLYGLESMHPHGSLIAAGGTVLSLASLGFGRRYLHGEFMYGRFAMLSAGLQAGFNIVATAPTLEHALAGWTLSGFSSAFLIGAFNDRPTARDNATYAFAAYQLSDCAVLAAAAFSAHHSQLALVAGAQDHHAALTASGLILAALIKSSQFPLTNLFTRSMEGASPTTAIGYAGVSAHAGVVLLASTTPLWFEFEWARLALASAGLITATNAGLLSHIRADRKGVIAHGSAASLGMIYCVLAGGYTDLALVLSLGHAALRMTQFLRSANTILDNHNMQSAIGDDFGPKVVPEWMYRFAWMCNRGNSDVNLPHVLHRLKGGDGSRGESKLALTKEQQWGATGLLVGVAGAPFTPLAHFWEDTMMNMLHTGPLEAVSLMGLHVALSTVLVRYVLSNVLDFRRFRHADSDKTSR